MERWVRAWELGLRPQRADPSARSVGRRLTELSGETYAIAGIRPASVGYANTTWLVDASPHPVAIKVQTSPAYVFGRDPAFEPGVISALHQTNVPVPELVARDDDETLFGSPWFATKLVAGVSMPDNQLDGYAGEGWFAEAEPGRRTAVWNSFVDVLAELHCLGPGVLGGQIRGGSHSLILDYWSASLHEVLPAQKGVHQEMALEWLRVNAPADADADPRPCMGDARMANIVERGGVVAALVDWELAHVGNPRGDVGYHLYMDRRYAAVAGRRLDGLPAADATWARWGARTGMTTTDRRYWEVFGAVVMSITTSRVMRLVYGLDPDDIEALNPFVADLQELPMRLGAG